MGKLMLEAISEVKTQKVRSDGKVSLKYYTAYFRDVENPFTGRGQRNFTQNHTADGKSGFWKDLAPEAAAQRIGKEFTGNIVRGETLPYDIDGRKATSYTCVVLKGEDTATIFAKAGKVLVEAQKELQLENVSF